MTTRHLTPRSSSPGKHGVIWLRTVSADGAVTYTLRWRGAGGRVRQSMLVLAPGTTRAAIALELHLVRLAVHAELRGAVVREAA